MTRKGPVCELSEPGEPLAIHPDTLGNGVVMQNKGCRMEIVKMKRVVSLGDSSGDEGALSESLHERLTLFAKVLFWIFVGLRLFAAVGWMDDAARPALANELHLLGVVHIVFVGAIWFFSYRAKSPSCRFLRALDTALLAGTALYFGVTVYLLGGAWDSIYVVLVFTVFVILGRVFIIPSSGHRSLWLSVMTMGSWVVAVYAVCHDNPENMRLSPVTVILGGTFVTIMAALLAAMGSSIIFGLRKQVRKAEQLGQYTLEEKIGEGGMGEIYRARHALLRRDTAIKLLRSDRTNERTLARFEREVQLTSQLTHPNTVSVYDYGRSSDGVFYYAMEYLEGIDLQRLVNQFGPQPQQRVIAILSQLCGSLSEAHEKGLIHRDIKPANVILCSQGLIPDVVKLVDFGLVKDINDMNSSWRGKIELAGTPAYLPPETIDGLSVDRRGDIYALGALGYFLLTGTTVFDADTMVDMLHHHLYTAPIPPSLKTDNAIALELEEILLHCLAKDRDQRPQSARDLAEALANIQSCQRWSEADAHTWWQRHGAIVAEEADREPRQILLQSTADLATAAAITAPLPAFPGSADSTLL